MKAAYTGVAASLIDGKTTHTIGMISLIIDEVSMIAKTFFALLSRQISIGKQKPGHSAGDMSFGGISVILCGDFHQFPPVAVAPSEALYYPTNIIRDTMESQIGRSIFEEFSTVVILREQMRVTDPEWRDFLTHLQYGRVQQQHLTMLGTMLLS